MIKLMTKPIDNRWRVDLYLFDPLAKTLDFTIVVDLVIFEGHLQGVASVDPTLPVVSGIEIEH